LFGLVEGGHSLDDEEIDSAGDEDADLVSKGGAGFVEAGFAEGFESDAEWADGSSDPGLPAGIPRGRRE
jgi:hypothetical protein